MGVLGSLGKKLGVSSSSSKKDSFDVDGNINTTKSNRRRRSSFSKSLLRKSFGVGSSGSSTFKMDDDSWKLRSSICINNLGTAEELMKQFNGIIELESWLRLWSNPNDANAIIIKTDDEFSTSMSPTMMAGALLNLGACFPDFHCSHKSIRPHFNFNPLESAEHQQLEQQQIIIGGFQCSGTHSGAPFVIPESLTPGGGKTTLPVIPVTDEYCLNDEQQIVLTVNSKQKIIRCEISSSASPTEGLDEVSEDDNMFEAHSTPFGVPPTKYTGLMIGFYQQIGGDKYWKQALLKSSSN